MFRFTSAGLLIIGLSLPAPVRAAEVSGRITDSDTGDGIPRAVVRALAQDQGQPSAQALTDQRGRYLLDLLRGRYRIQVEVPDSNYLPRQYGGSGDAEAGDFLHIPTFDSFIVLDLSLTMGGSVAGRVRGEGEAPLAKVTIRAESADHRVSTATGEDGSYLLSRLPPGEFLISAGTRDQRYVSAYYPESSHREDARPVAVQQRRKLTGIDFVLQRAGAIRGRIRALKGMEPLEGVRVVAEKQGASPISRVATSDSQGRYRLAGLSPGSYLLSAGPPEGDDTGRQQPGWLRQFYPQQFHRESAVALDLESGLTLSGIDFTLMQECWISGRVVTLGDEEPLEEVQVIPQPVMLRGFSPTRTRTDGSGDFLLQGLPPGDYTLGMLLPARHRRLIRVYYRDKLSLDRADRIELEEGKALRDIDFNLAAGASLSGRVGIEEPEEELEYQWDSSRDVVELARLDFDPRGSEDRRLRVEEDGSFRVDGTPGGRYSLTPRLSDPNLIALRSPLPRVVTVVEGDLLQELDFAFRIGGSISGSVESASEAPGLNQLQIVLINFVENTSSVFDLPSPQYTLAGLSPGRYFLALRSKPDATHPSRGYGISQVFDSRLVDVVKGAGTSNVDLRVPPTPAGQSPF
ncbi:MAG: carboxypeptidase regulatory-like domain-containing protein [Acidobacteriota bacterium]|nr:carboxypeptidase regulatory-like domain-containing protein [Acidobacteriota bacterium]